MTRLGQYEILSKLASGGMGVVYRAIHVSLHREVALKVLLPELANDSNALARFQREAQSASKLRHPNIIEVYDLGQADGQNYMAMEYLPDGSLQQKMRELAVQDRVMSEEEALRLIRPVADALNYAHARGLVHRDIKPSNILLRADGTPILADFGIVLASSATRLTKNLTTIGTPEYMSPEQGRGGAIDGRSDLYSLGIVLYEMLAGNPPFSADTPIAVVYKHIKEPLPALLRNDVSQRTRRIIEKVTAKDPNDRFQTGAEMAQAIDQALAELPRGRGISATMPIASTGSVPVAVPPDNRRQLVLAALVVAALLVLVAGVAVAYALVNGNGAILPGQEPTLTPSAAAAKTIGPTSTIASGVIVTPTSTSAATVTPDLSNSPTPIPTDTPPPTFTPLPTDTPPPTRTPLPSGSCLPGYVYRLAKSTDKICVPPASHTQALADNAAAASRRVVATDGPDTCKSGFVWRGAFTNDHVCVTSSVQTQAQSDNAAAASRKLLQYGPDTCISGYVWRDAFTDDHVCVTGAVRAQAAADNAAAASRVDPGGAYGPNSCVSGYVWREAISTDLVCVTGAVRSQTQADNAAAASRRVVASDGPDTCISGYVWRMASSSDHVCVTPAVYTQTQSDNAAAASRKLLQYGPDTCIDGYVWRMAYTGDHVCVTPAVYTQTQTDNSHAPSHTVP